MTRSRLALAAAVLASVTTSARAQEKPAAAGGASYSAEGQLGSVADMKRFSDEMYDAHFSFTKSAKVSGLVLRRDSAELHLDGHVLVKPPVRGVTATAVFFGKGRFRMTAPVAIERQQIKRFLGTETVDVPIRQATIVWTGADDQAIFDGLTQDEAGVAALFADDKEARDWKKEMELVYSQSAEEVDARRRLFQMSVAQAVYERLMDPKKEGELLITMEVDVPEKADTSRSVLSHLQYSFSPERDEEVTLQGGFDHGDQGEDEAHWSLVTQFHRAGQHDGPLQDRATSAVIEAERAQEVGLAHDKLRMVFTPGEKIDLRMRSEMDLVALKDGIKMIDLDITPVMGATKAWLDGKEIEFFHPEIPGARWLHSSTITVALPKPLAKGERVALAMELEGQILQNVDGSTWVVKEEDVWFPNPASNLGTMPTKFDTTLVVPKGFIAVANGAEAPCAPGDATADQTCFHFVTNTGINFATFNIGRDFRVDRGKALDGTPIAVYTNRDAKREFRFVDDNDVVQKRSYSLSSTAPAIVEKAKLALATYEDWFGEDPYDSLWLTPHVKGHGRGSASLLLLYQGAFLSATDDTEWHSIMEEPRQPWGSDAFIAHEIAHQWWGGAAGIRSSRDQWFSEGFANYGSVLTLEQYDKVNKTNWMMGELAAWKERLLKDDGYINTVSPLALGSRVNSPENRRRYENAYSWYIYDKGGWVMHMLRVMARAKLGDKDKGDALFKQAIHQFMEKHRNKEAPSNLDLENSLAASYNMKPEMEKFFQQWVYGLGVPKIQFSYEVVPGPNGNMLRGRIRQKDTAFTFPVSVFLHTKAVKGDPPFFYQWVKKADDTFEVGPIPFVPDKVTLNDDQGLLAAITTVPWTGAPAGPSAAGQ